MEDPGELWNIFRLKRDISEIYFRSFFQEYRFPEGLNSTHLQTMIYLDILGTSPMTRISQILQLEKGSFTPVARKLTDMGYLKKDRAADDKRVYQLGLTPSGESLVKDFKEKHWAYIRRNLSQLPEAEQDEYFSLMEKLNTINAKLRDELGIRGIFD